MKTGIRAWLFSFKRHLHSLKTLSPFISTPLFWFFSLSIQMLHSHLHLNLQFLSLHSSLPSSKRYTIPFPTPIRRASSSSSSSTLRLRNCTRRIRSSAANDKVNETEQKKPSQQIVNRAYPFHEIEPKWQRFWEQYRTFRTPDDDIDMSKPKYYILDMFPYPRF